MRLENLYVSNAGEGMAGERGNAASGGAYMALWRSSS